MDIQNANATLQHNALAFALSSGLFNITLRRLASRCAVSSDEGMSNGWPCPQTIVSEVNSSGPSDCGGRGGCGGCGGWGGCGGFGSSAAGVGAANDEKGKEGACNQWQLEGG